MFLVVKSSSSTSSHKKSTQYKPKPAKKATQYKPKPAKKVTLNKSRAGFKKASSSPAKMEEEKTPRLQDEVVTYDEIDFRVREIVPSGKQVLVGPPFLTRFERARITGARSLQLSLGAPALVEILGQAKDSVTLACMELDAKALPISIRRVLPNGVYQNIPADWLK